MTAPDGEVLGTDGRAQRLSEFTREGITLLGFIYTTCVDPEGCPLAYRVFDALKRAITDTPALHGRVRFVTLSFDPARDSPAVMRRYAGSRLRDGGGAVPWYFLTTRSARELMPVVEGFGQDIRYTVDRSTGKPRRELSHVLKVFLIDRAGFVREIYSSMFLHPKTVLNDIETLVLEERAAVAAAQEQPRLPSPALDALRPGPRPVIATLPEPDVLRRRLDTIIQQFETSGVRPVVALPEVPHSPEHAARLASHVLHMRSPFTFGVEHRGWFILTDEPEPLDAFTAPGYAARRGSAALVGYDVKVDLRVPLSIELTREMLIANAFVAYTDLWAIGTADGDPIVFEADGTARNVRAGLGGRWHLADQHTLVVNDRRFTWSPRHRSLFSPLRPGDDVGFYLLLREHRRAWWQERGK
jgi:cytochrome oxidase Cu insertion factor (SCO1/SenC/PrrC family)